MVISQLLEMMGNWSFITLKMVSWWVQSPMIQSGETMVTWIPCDPRPEPRDPRTWLPGYLVTWLPNDPRSKIMVTRDPRIWLALVPGYLVTLVPGYLGGWVVRWLGNLVTLIPGYPDTWLPGYPMIM